MVRRQRDEEGIMKRDPISILEQMFEALEKGGPFTLNELSQETGIHSITLKRYIRLVRLVREEPELEVIRTKHAMIVRIRKVKNAGSSQDI